MESIPSPFFRAHFIRSSLFFTKFHIKHETRFQNEEKRKKEGIRIQRLLYFSPGPWGDSAARCTRSTHLSKSRCPPPRSCLICRRSEATIARTGYLPSRWGALQTLMHQSTSTRKKEGKRGGVHNGFTRELDAMAMRGLGFVRGRHGNRHGLLD